MMERKISDDEIIERPLCSAGSINSSAGGHSQVRARIEPAKPSGPILMLACKLSKKEKTA